MLTACRAQTVGRSLRFVKVIPLSQCHSARKLEVELRAILAADNTLPELLEPQPDEPTVAKHELLCAGDTPYFVVPIPVPARPGSVWVSRLPGLRPLRAAKEVRALVEFGVNRVVCLVPENVICSLHGADRYLSEARAAFGPRFHEVAVADHQVPLDDGEFEACVAQVDRALAEGEKVLVHCVGGCGRSGMFTACVMVHGGIEPREAILRFRRNRKCGPETVEQIAYVFRYAGRHRPLIEGGSSRLKSISRVTISMDGSVPPKPVCIARGGLSTVLVGRAHFTGGGCRRVAVKRFSNGTSKTQIDAMQSCVTALYGAGVQLPPLTFFELGGGVWAQITPLFGSIRRGSKFGQPGLFYRELSARQKDFAMAQLTRVVNAAYVPSIDLFVRFENGKNDIVPIDLDLLEHDPGSEKAVRKLLNILVIQLGTHREERDRLLTVVHAHARPGVRRLVDATFEQAGGYRAYWDLE